MNLPPSFRLLIPAALLAIASAGSPSPSAPQRSAPIDYNRDIRPIVAATCFACHGQDAKQIQAGLRLDRAEEAVKRLPSGHTAIIPGQPQQSELVKRVFSPSLTLRMPPAGSNKTLTDAEKDLLQRWVAEGARYQRHWAFITPKVPALPAVRLKSWPRNEIDYFVLAKLESQGLKPSPEADRRTLIRRVSLDLNGIPPTPAEVDAFLADRTPDAYEKVVDRLLASPRFGERMAMPWLDGARYADSNGYQADYERFQWRWRDWVINAFNRNMPFDQFTVEQIAGDLLPNATVEQRIATGFNRNHRINTEGGIIPEEWRVETVVDRVETTSAVWLGLTLGCGRCHDHKYDPITQKEFYQFYAFFNNVPESGVGTELPVNHPPLVRVPSPEDEKRLKQLEGAFAWRQMLAVGSTGVQSDPKLDKEEIDKARKARDEFAAKIPTVMVMEELPNPRECHILLRGQYDKPGEKVTAGLPAAFPPMPPGAPANRLGLSKWMVDPSNPLTARVAVNRFWEQLFGTGIVATTEDFGVRAEFPTHPDLLDWLATQFAGLQISTAAHAETQRRQEGQERITTETQRHRVVYASLEVTSRKASKGAKNQTQAAARSFPPYQGGTEGGAAAVAVAVSLSLNPISQIPNPKPWDVKALLKLIVTSATYRQSSRITPELLRRDPDNRLLARGPRFRLPAETIRDQALAVSGLLVEKQGGPSVRPYQPEGFWDEINVYGNLRNYKADKGEGLYRRSLYTFWKRTAGPPSMALFDVPGREMCRVRRSRTNTPLQALSLLNEVTFVEASRVLAQRMLTEGGASPAARIDYAFRRAVSRPPTPLEARTLLNGYINRLRRYRASPAEAAKLLTVGEAPRPAGLDDAELAATTVTASIILNMDETVTKE